MDHSSLNSKLKAPKTRASSIEKFFSHFRLSFALLLCLAIQINPSNLKTSEFSYELEPNQFFVSQPNTDNYVEGHHFVRAAIPLENGTFLLMFEADDSFPNYSYGVYGRIFDKFGTAIIDETLINDVYNKSQYIHNHDGVVRYLDNSFLIAWRCSYGEYNVYVRKFNNNLNAIGPKILVNEQMLGVNSGQAIPVALGSGHFMVAYNYYNLDEWDVYAGCFDPSGTRLGGEIKINEIITNSQVVLSAYQFLDESLYLVFYRGIGNNGQGLHVTKVNVTCNKVEEYDIKIGFLHGAVFKRLMNGNYALLWQKDSVGNFFTQVFNSGLNQISLEVQATFFNTSSSLVNLVNGRLCPLNDGYLFLFTRYPPIERFGQKVHFNGSLNGNVFKINTVLNDDYGGEHTCTSLSTGGFVTLYDLMDENYRSDMTGTDAFGRISTPMFLQNSLNLTKTCNHQMDFINNLGAIDLDSLDNEIVFTFRNIQHGKFARIDMLDQAITSFTQLEVKSGIIYFVHDCGSIAPSYEVKVSDGDSESLYETAEIYFVPVEHIFQWWWIAIGAGILFISISIVVVIIVIIVIIILIKKYRLAVTSDRIVKKGLKSIFEFSKDLDDETKKNKFKVNNPSYPIKIVDDELSRLFMEHNLMEFLEKCRKKKIVFEDLKFLVEKKDEEELKSIFNNDFRVSRVMEIITKKSIEIEKKKNTKKFAFIVGNSEYEHFQKLKNASKDAEDICKLLTSLEFECSFFKNLGGEDLIDEFETFTISTQEKVKDFPHCKILCVVYFAGHGVFTEDDEMFLPIDAHNSLFNVTLPNNFDSMEKVIKEKLIERKITKKRMEILNCCLTEISIKNHLSTISDKNIKFCMFFDACRNSKKLNIRFSLESETRDIIKKSDSGYIISYSTEKKERALDESRFGGNSPYCRSLLKRLKEKGDLIKILHKVNEDVREDTNNNQVPVLESTLNIDWN